ncbi:hypothetical protein [Actinoplanes sp. GCM10030250]|uniref:hypothetical protein n=1 Tax=Actinoplanes sp. GCM10030250 TaxID=3273376 RepID=UPI0036241043
MAAQQLGRWAALSAVERERRQRQSQADKARAVSAPAGARTPTPISEAERRRRQSQSDQDRARNDAADEHEEAMYRTVLGGDINFMDKHDW